MPNWMSEGNVAVITGGASGIGLAAARRFLGRGMKVVIADVDEEALARSTEILTNEVNAADRLASQICNVAQSEDLMRLKEYSYDRFGAVNCLMNNAGVVYRGGAPWDDVDAMKSLIDVNVWGVVHGCRAFIPSMLDSGKTGVVINTGSKQGITRPPGNIAYNMSKSAVLAYTESLAYAFRQIDGCQLSAHLLVPGFVYTGMVSKFVSEKPPVAATSEETVDYMIEALDRDEFYIICPDNETNREIDEKRMQWTADDLIKNRPPLSRWHPDHAEAFEAFMQSPE